MQVGNISYELYFNIVNVNDTILFWKEMLALKTGSAFSSRGLDEAVLVNY